MIDDKPKEYKTQKVDFCGETFYIDERAYIPTIETEQLVNLVKEEANNPSSIVDVGTGSGCIAVTLAKEFPSAKIYAVDIDEKALKVTRKNVKIHKTANIICSSGNYVDNLDIFSPNIIVANLPWGDERYVLKSNSPEKLKFEPKIAIFHPKGILGAYEELIASIVAKKWKTKLYFETGEMPKIEIQKIIPKNLKWEYYRMQNYSVSKVVFT
ncbi:MAG: methyltransferase [Candidatus Pacebacteria bacterium]|nr:methyltransferase [Candidatus Paceibacterota bacterium]MDD5356716.1 methyltransferase [Candidatus Paceibacterota bacterium]